MRDFFWEGGDLGGGNHLAAWEEVCRSRKEGGLGIGGLELKNKGMLMKWLWRFPLEENSLWHKVIVSRYEKANNFWDSKVGVRMSPKGSWRDISNLYSDYLELVCFKVGKGDRIRFWEDVWIGDTSLKSDFPDLAVISKAKNASIWELVVDEGLPGDFVRSWNFKFRRNLLDRGVPTLISLVQRLEHIKLLNVDVDIRLWKPDPGGIFSCKSAFGWLNSNSNQSGLS
uniref:Uncharacterized protein n=1 Tax=Cannabis sativa TaxID=3483 RepID=A0A803PJL9_CANSA